MNESLKEWLECCAGRLDRDSCNLLGLFKSGLTQSELASVFGPFPHSQEMLRRVNRVLDAGNISGYIYLQQPKLGDSAQVIAAGKQWLAAQVRYCALTGELEVANRVDGIDVEIVGAERFEEAQATPSVNDDLHHHVRQSIWWTLPDEPQANFALVEALYGIAADYDLAWYVMQPLLSIDLDFSKYFDFWRLGGRGMLTDRAYLIAKRE